MTLPPLPLPLPPAVVRFDDKGRPTREQVEFERRMTEFLKALAAATQGT